MAPQDNLRTGGEAGKTQSFQSPNIRPDFLRFRRCSLSRLLPPCAKTKDSDGIEPLLVDRSGQDVLLDELAIRPALQCGACEKMAVRSLRVVCSFRIVQELPGLVIGQTQVVHRILKRSADIDQRLG